MSLPQRMDVVDDLGTGAIIRHQTDDYNAVILGYGVLKKGEGYLACRLVFTEADLRKSKTKLRNYENFFISNSDRVNWLVLDVGNDDYVLGEGE